MSHLQEQLEQWNYISMSSKEQCHKIYHLRIFCQTVPRHTWKRFRFFPKYSKSYLIISVLRWLYWPQRSRHCQCCWHKWEIPHQYRWHRKVTIFLF
jgi:hypothetical protein